MNIKDELNYCLNCKNKPCKTGCPLENDIPMFIHLSKEGKYKEAYETLTKTTVLPAICGRVCPHEKQCQGKCIRGIKGKPVSIGKIEANIADFSFENDYKISKCIDEDLIGKRVAIIGSGPAGLTAAAFLARNGVNVTIYEKHSKPGGILEHGIPNFRLDENILKTTIEKILNIGNIEIKCNNVLGKDIMLNELKNEYDAIFLAFGANVSCKINIPGEDLDGVYGANEILEYNRDINIDGKNVAVIGAGNVAMDMARTAIRKSAKSVNVIYRRAEEQAPAEKEEIQMAKTEGVNFIFQKNVINILPKENTKSVNKIEYISTKLISKDGEDRLFPVNVEGTNYFMDMDLVIMASGSCTDEELVKSLNLELDKYNNIKVDNEYKTSMDKIFAGGDLIGEKATVAWAARNGREAAYSIMRYLKENN